MNNIKQQQKIIMESVERIRELFKIEDINVPEVRLSLDMQIGHIETATNNIMIGN